MMETGQTREHRENDVNSDAPPETEAECNVPGKTGDGHGTSARIPSSVFFSAFASSAAIVTILFELYTGLCANAFADPIPSALHLSCLALVPIILIFTAFKLKRGMTAASLPWLYSLNGFLLAVSLWYAVCFLPLMPIAAFMVLWYGFGLMPLSPSLSLVAAVHQSFQLARYGRALSPGKSHVRHRFAGAALAAALILGWDIRIEIVERAMQTAITAPSPARDESMATLKLLRAEDIVLSYCYAQHERLRPFLQPFGFQKNAYSSGIMDIRTLYYRLTGRDYREAPRPPRMSARRRINWFDSPESRSEVGGTTVGSLAPRLSLDIASLDISVSSSPNGEDAGPGVAYAEMTLEFANSGSSQQEARAQIIMPPGGVASRLTLWIDGEEREAAFGLRGAVRSAYGQVVARKLDPALLTEDGPDRVLLQCFPVPPKSRMKVKAGFTLPLVPAGGRMALQMPYFAERNFANAPGMSVAVSADSRTRLTFDAKSLAVSGSNLRGAVSIGELASAVIFAPSPKPRDSIYGANLSGVQASCALAEIPLLDARTMAVVLDSSRQCAAVFRPGGRDLDWAAILSQLPDNVQIALFAGSLYIPPMSREEARRQWPEALSKLDFSTADEQAGNLAKAWDLCAQSQNGAVLWLHGNLPIDIASTTDVETKMSLRAAPAGTDAAPRLLSLQMIPGPNRIEEKLAYSGMERLPAFYGLPAEDRLKGAFAMSLYPRLNDRELAFSLSRPQGYYRQGQSSPHIVRLAYSAEITRKLREGARASDMEADAATAVNLRLVTPLTGAVVLENEQQYAEHGLDPNKAPQSVPTIPEPEEWALLAIVLAFLSLLYII
ncbi:MAG: hypothetical protein LBQ36_02590, partial [Synergistaceae bacterium]|nr:hypothetical protein [Synergistaceae bacterium]